jgi:hypothetical protein
MKRFVKIIWKPLLLVAPPAIGMLGFWREGESFLQALFNCVCMYALNYQETPANVLIEISRWLAPLATASGLVLVLSSLQQWFHRVAARCTGKSVAVYGVEPEKSAVLKQLGVRSIPMDRELVKAKQYILLGTEKENLAFYHKHEEAFAKREVFIKCQSLPAQASTRAGLHLFCPEETAARFFWEQYCPYPISVQCGHKMKIVILGFGKLGKELLLQALQNHIFHPEQKIEYHIFGEAGSFCAVHHQLHQIADPVFFHEEPWYEQVALLSAAEMIVVAQQEDQMTLLQELTLTLPQKTVHALLAEPNGAAMLPGVVCFDWVSTAYHPEHILGNRLYAYAKKINLRYAHLYGGVEETTENLEKQWAALDTFTRYSNISAADYHGVQLKMIAHEGWQDPLEQPYLERLAELEHIRWCRYHYLQNWRYGIPENGKAKDGVRRIHSALRPYGQLPDSEREKDRENIRVLLQLDRDYEKGGRT